MSWRDGEIRGLARRILGRFPQHLEADGRGKRLGDLVDALSADLERLGVSMAQVRRARRPAQADELLDLWRLGALHGLSADELDLLLLRELPFRRRLAAQRARLVEISRRHAEGNATVEALLEGAAAAADLEPFRATLAHSDDRFWHGVWCVDRPALLAAREGGAVDPVDAPEPEHLVLEENPAEERETERTPRRHGERWSVHRDGFGPVPVDLRVEALGERTLGALVVQRERGVALGIARVPAGFAALFDREGVAHVVDPDDVDLDDTDLSEHAFVVEGGVFSEEGEPEAVEWRFAGDGDDPNDDANSADDAPSKVARFAVSTPFADLPEAASRRLELPVGTAHLAVFVRRRSVVDDLVEVPERKDLPRFDFGQFDRIGYAADRPVAADAAAADAVAADEPVALVSLAWRQHRPFSVRLHLPPRLRALAEDAGAPPSRVTESVLRALRRLQPAGVAVEAFFADDADLPPVPDELVAALEATTPDL